MNCNGEYAHFSNLSTRVWTKWRLHWRGKQRLIAEFKKGQQRNQHIRTSLKNQYFRTGLNKVETPVERPTKAQSRVHPELIFQSRGQQTTKETNKQTNRTEANKGSVQSSSVINISEQVPPRFRSKTHPHCWLLLSKSLLQPHCVTLGIFGVDLKILWHCSWNWKSCKLIEFFYFKGQKVLYW